LAGYFDVRVLGSRVAVGVLFDVGEYDRREWQDRIGRAGCMTADDIVLIFDLRIWRIEVAECGEPLVDLRVDLLVDGRSGDEDGWFVLAREGGAVRERLVVADQALPGRVGLLAAGCWLLAAGCWLLAAGCWLLLGEALGAAGMVNHPGEWWHWSYGDPYSA
jgi:hypothetical protein